MKKCLLLLFLVVQVTFSQEKTTTIYLIRHAEKVDNSKNPDLSPEGIKRSLHWNEVFSAINFDAVYSTNFNRTLQTAAPIAKKNSIEIKIYDPKTMDIEKIKKEHVGQTILIVGHSNSTPDLVNKLINQNIYPAIDETNFGNLYIVTINENTVNHQLLKSL